MDGLLVVNKPSGRTSHDIVSLVRRRLQTRRVGHTGTLDPLATGVLVLCVGKALKLVEYLSNSIKTYHAIATLGATSTTLDAEGDITTRITRPLPFPRPHLERTLKSFEGDLMQRPPAHSAIKVQGTPAHRRLRRGETVTLAPRPVTIHAIHFINFSWPHLEFKVKCSAGTYIRSLVRDIGENLLCGAYLSSLRRTRAGIFTLRDAIEPDQISPSYLLPPFRAVEHLRRVRVTPAEVSKLLHGQAISTTERFSADPGPLVLFDGQEIVGIARYDRRSFLLRPQKILLTNPS